MKRLISFAVLLVVTFIMSYSAIADENHFTVRNGIMFGLTKKEVMEIEKSNGNDPSSSSNWVTVDDNVAGFDECNITYEFKGSKLDMIEYSWNEKFETAYNFINEADNAYRSYQLQFDTLNETLLNKYDMIGSNSGRNEASFVNFNIGDDYVYRPFAENGRLDCQYDVYGFSQYITADGDDYVEIIIKCYKEHYHPNYYSLAKEHIYCNVVIYYRRIPQNVMKNTMDSAEELESKRDSDL